MDSLFHFVFSVIGAMALDLHKKHRLVFVMSAASFAVLIDFDHFFNIDPLYAKPLHNIFVAILIPLALFYIAYRYERNLHPRRTELQKFFLVVMVMLVGHLVADMFYSQDFRVKLFYPLSYESYSFADLPLPTPLERYDFITSQGVALLFYSIILLSVLFAEDFIKWHEEKHESVRRSIKDVVKDFF
ncbi:MAG: metal-dependent hydrolase [Candidatus Micrarchaeota archaeon]